MRACELVNAASSATTVNGVVEVEARLERSTGLRSAHWQAEKGHGYRPAHETCTLRGRFR